MLEKYLCNALGPCKNKVSGYCNLIPGACSQQWVYKSNQECCVCSHRKVCKYREEFEQKKKNTYIKLECKYFIN